MLTCGDIHLNTDLLLRAFSLAQETKIDLIIFVGDFCEGAKLPETASSSDFLRQAQLVIELIKKITIPIFFVLGNHDPPELATKLDQIYHLTDLHDQNIDFHNYKFAGIGGSHFIVPQLVNNTLPFLEGIFPAVIDIGPNLEHVRTLTRNGVTQYIYSGVHIQYQDLFPCDVLVSHTPPMLPSNGNYQMASVGLYQLISCYKPLLSISGHVHTPDTHVEVLEWSRGASQAKTTLLHLGSLDGGKVGLVEFSRSEKCLERIEMVHLSSQP